jgi:predicted membrane metal-binding protein
MLASILVWNLLFFYNPGFHNYVAAVFSILLLRKPLQALVKAPYCARSKSRPRWSQASGRVFNLQVATTFIIAVSFEKVSVIGVLRNLVAVPLFGPILTLGLLGPFAGNLVVPLAYLTNACNGLLVTLLAWVAEAVSALPIAAVEMPGATLTLAGLFYLGCVPATIVEITRPEERWPKVAGALMLWA